MSRKRRPEGRTPTDTREVVGFLGIGLDQDGHSRVTKAEHFLLVGGSAETHERMQETVVRFEEALDKAGKRLGEVSPEEAADLLRDANRNI
jgi:exosome complex RNA-binding protein Rrp42 (RNase PH superfamily)